MRLAVSLGCVVGTRLLSYCATALCLSQLTASACMPQLVHVHHVGLHEPTLTISRGTAGESVALLAPREFSKQATKLLLPVTLPSERQTRR